MAGRKEDQEELDEEVLSPLSWTVHSERAQEPERIQNNNDDDDEYAPLYDELIDPILSTERAQKPQEPRSVGEHKDQREKKSSIRKVRTLNTSSKPKRSFSKAGGKKRGSRKKSTRQETKVTNRKNWTELIQNLIALMRASKKGKKVLDPDERRQRKAAFRKRVTVLLVPFFKKPREEAAFLAFLEAKEPCARGTEISQAKRVTNQFQEETFMNDHSGEKLNGKKSVIWSMFSVDWDSTRVQRRRAARERAVLRHEQVGNALRETRGNILERSARSVVQRKRNRAVELRRENERQHWRLLKEEIVGYILEGIRMIAFFKKLCRPRLLAKLKQAATACGASQSFDNFVAALPVNEDFDNWVRGADQHLNKLSDEEIVQFLETNQKNAPRDYCRRNQRYSGCSPDLPKGDAQVEKSSTTNGSDSTFSDISNQLEELEDVIRSALDDFDPE